MAGTGTEDSNATSPGNRDDTPTLVEAATPHTTSPSAKPDDRPFRIGRYTVLRPLGRGGMGVVYAAYDDELDRRIALKVLTTGDAGGSLGKARMQREAQALARLSHPNVVQVYEVGLADARLYLAMEFVEGHDLKEWLAAAPRTWRQVVDVCVQAGRGLAAAHAAGLIHRDFKPANTIVGADGRVRVIDFGLARADLETGDPGLTLTGRALTTSSSLVDHLTQAGTLIGTPAYMAPEQLFRHPADARSDLYAFCVTLWEALYGARPYEARTVDELRAKVIHGPPAPPHKRVPAAVQRVLARGLAFAAEDRPSGMPALLADLTRATDARRRLYLSLGAAAAIVGASAGGYLIARPPTATIDPQCIGAADLTGVWDPETRGAVEASLRATGLVYASDTWTAVAPRLDDYASELAELRRESCLARSGPAASLPPALAEQALCVERRRLALSAVIRVLRRADAGVVAGAVDTVGGLEPLAPCRDLAALAVRRDPTQTIDDPEREAALSAVWEQLAEARAEHLAEHYKRGREIADAALATAERLADQRLLAAALLRAARLHEGDGDADGARALTHRAFAVAEAARDDDLQVGVATTLVRLEGADLRDLTAARVWHEVARARLARVGGTDTQRVNLLLEAGIAYIEAGALAEGTPLIHEAVVLAEKIRLQDPRLHISALNIQASGVFKRTGQLDEAEAIARRLIDLGQQHFGRGHPYNGMLIYNLGAIQYLRADFEPALENFQRSLVLREDAYGRDHIEVAQSLNGLAAALGDLDRRDEAIPHAKRALAIEEASRGADHPELVFPLNNLASILLQAGRPDEAEPYLVRARKILDARDLGDNSLSAMVDESLANLALTRGRPDEARTLLARALATVETHLGKDNPSTAHLDLALAELLLDQHKPAAAAPHLTRAAEILRSSPASPDGAKLRELAARAAGNLPPAPASP